MLGQVCHRRLACIHVHDKRLSVWSGYGTGYGTQWVTKLKIFLNPIKKDKLQDIKQIRDISASSTLNWEREAREYIGDIYNIDQN